MYKWINRLTIKMYTPRNSAKHSLTRQLLIWHLLNTRSMFHELFSFQEFTLCRNAVSSQRHTAQMKQAGSALTNLLQRKALSQEPCVCALQTKLHARTISCHKMLFFIFCLKNTADKARITEIKKEIIQMMYKKQII